MIDFFVNIGHAIMTPLYYLTSGILVLWHNLFYDILGLSEGWSWAMSHHLPHHRHPDPR